jgi:GTP cyclohydrolase I
MVEFANPPSKVKSDSGDDISSPGGSEYKTPNATKRRSDDGESSSRKRKRKRALKANGETHSRRRHSVSKPARDPRDDPSPTRPTPEIAGTRSPSPVIDFDGLSHPSMSPHFSLYLLSIG